MSLTGIFIATEILKEKVKTAIEGALVSRGKNKGMLKAKCPPMGTFEASAWQAIILHANPFKVGFGHLIFFSAEQREIYDYIDNKIKTENISVSGLDRDRKALEAFGVW